MIIETLTTNATCRLTSQVPIGKRSESIFQDPKKYVILYTTQHLFITSSENYRRHPYGGNKQDSTECLLMLINIIHEGSMPDSSSTTYPTGASLSDILFSFVLEKYIVCDVCGLRSPSFESSSVLYISPTDTSSMQNLILEGLQQKLQKSCSRCNKNTWHVESSYILQPPKYLLLFVNRFRYINNNVTKDRCPIGHLNLAYGLL